MKVVIIGGGASGLVTAINACNNSNEVIILEKNNKCGKKILVTGNGRCNYFNDDFNINHYHSNDIDILKTIINEEHKEKVLMFFDSIGIIPKIQNNYYYPITNQAITIEESLVRTATNMGVKIKTDTIVTNVTYKDKYYIETSNGVVDADIVVLALGSKAAPKTGSDGLGYTLASNFNHSIIKPLPALVQLKSVGNFLKDWSGIRTDVKLSLYIDNKLDKEVVGEAQLTDYGISGICTYQLSSKAIRSLDNNHKVDIHINFLPWLHDDLKNFLDKRNNVLKNNTISELLDGLLNYKLSNLILKKNKISYDEYYSELTSIELSSLINDLVNFKLNITGYNDFDSAQVCSGGIPLNEINIKTMESLNNKNLYIVGELLDVDGECGGYNLGFAWLSGILAGTHIKEYYD